MVGAVPAAIGSDAGAAAPPPCVAQPVVSSSSAAEAVNVQFFIKHLPSLPARAATLQVRAQRILYPPRAIAIHTPTVASRCDRRREAVDDSLEQCHMNSPGGAVERKRVNSSRIRSAGYDPQKQVLEVEFSDGRIMSYRGVSAEVHRQFVNAPSPVSFFEDKIAENYPETRVR
jgi:hypothetical protein